MRLSFSQDDWQRREALAVSFDLCGFSSFCSHPDAHANLPKLISCIFLELDAFLVDPVTFKLWPSSKPLKVVEPDFIKYSGDGALLLWFLPDQAEARQHKCTTVVRVMRLFQERLESRLMGWRDNWGAPLLPSKSRFGIAMGHVLELRPDGILPIKFGLIDYVGYCINLAVRLQDNLLGVPFLIHMPVAPKIEGLIRFTAMGMKGVLKEDVLLFPEHQKLLTNKPEPEQLSSPPGKSLKYPMETQVKTMFSKSPRQGVRLAYKYFEAVVLRVEDTLGYEFSQVFAQRFGDLVKSGMLSIVEQDRIVRIGKAIVLAEGDPSFSVSDSDAWAACEDMFHIIQSLDQKLADLND